MVYHAYCDFTGAEHQERFDALSPNGYRLISISVYGDPKNPRYAAVWVQRGGGLWQAIHGVNGATYQASLDRWTSEGYIPVLASVAGGGSDTVFAAVFEQGIGGAWMARHDMISGSADQAGSFLNQDRVARSQGLGLRSVAVYGDTLNRRYAAIWHVTPPGFGQSHLYPSETADSYQTVFETETQLPGVALSGYRPAIVTLAGDQLYSAVFRDDSVGEWAARHRLTARQYQDEIQTQAERGFNPISVQGGGFGGGARFAALFAKQDVAMTRLWRATGDPVAELAGLDSAMVGFMLINGVRAGQLAVAKDGVMKFSRAYTWAEAEYRTIQPSDPFLLASCSKMFLAAAVQSLYDARELTPATRVYPLLGFSNPLDPRSDEITVQQLLDHTAGYDDTGAGSGYDPTYSMRQIALDLQLGRPADKLDIARYMYTRYMLDFAPGMKGQYSNYGYLLASAVVEQVSGRDFFTYLSANILQPEGLGGVLVSSTRAAERAPQQAIAEDQGLGLNPLDLNSSALVPAVYGGDQEIKEVAAACAGLACSAETMVRFIHSHAVWGNGGRAAGLSRTGSTFGASTVASSRADGIDWALTLNTRDWPPNSSLTYNSLIGDEIHAGLINDTLSSATLP